MPPKRKSTVTVKTEKVKTEKKPAKPAAKQPAKRAAAEGDAKPKRAKKPRVKAEPGPRTLALPPAAATIGCERRRARPSARARSGSGPARVVRARPRSVGEEWHGLPSSEASAHDDAVDGCGNQWCSAPLSALGDDALLTSASQERHRHHHRAGVASCSA